MNRSLLVALAIGGILCLGLLTYVGGNLVNSTKKVQNEATSYADRIIPTFVKPWSFDTFQRYASKKLKDGTPEPLARRWFKFYESHLGSATNIKPAEVRQGRVTSSASGNTVEIHVASRVQFERDSGVVELWLIQAGTQWSVDRIAIDSSSLRTALANGETPDAQKN